jgi:hypothetical protein
MLLASDYHPIIFAEYPNMQAAICCKILTYSVNDRVIFMVEIVVASAVEHKRSIQ